MGTILNQCDHVAKVLDWGVLVEGTEAILRPSRWGCTQCDQTWDESPSESLSVASGGISEHSILCECFGCKAKTLKVAYSGIGGGDYTTQKRWDRNLEAYRQARAEGIQPKGTSEAAVKAAVRHSDKTGTAFKAG